MVTRSIDVGSMFLMDLSVNESELSNGLDADGNLSSLDNDLVFSHNQQHKLTTQSIDSYNKQHKQNKNSNNKHPAHNTNHYHDQEEEEAATTTRRSNNTDKHLHRTSELLSRNNSLDRLTNVINEIHHKSNNSSSARTATFEPNPDIVIGSGGDKFILAAVAGGQQLSASSSLSYQQSVGGSSTVTSHSSDGSGGGSSSSSSSSGASSCNDNDAVHDMHSLSSEQSYQASPSDYDTNHERASTTREDSGVLDMKDLVGSQKSGGCSFEENHLSEHINFINHDNKQISNNIIKATNLIINNNEKSADNNYLMTAAKPTATNPTKFNNNNNNNNNNNHHHHHRHHHQNHHHNSNQGSKRSVSASLPIEVPTRQMKKNLNKLKLNLINQNVASPGCAGSEDKDNITATTSNTTNIKTSNCTSACNDYQNNDKSLGYDDFDEFLEQEYNENHHKHYPMKEHEHFRADEDPMKLFESIQALARSLHEDTELFGSLPPKRMLESPIRSLALV